MFIKTRVNPFNSSELHLSNSFVLINELDQFHSWKDPLRFLRFKIDRQTEH